MQDAATASVDNQAGLATLLAPRSVAIIGASNDPSKMSGRPLANFRRFGFPGAVYPVNPRGGEIQGYKAFAAIGDIGEPIDLTLVMTPASSTVDAVRQGIEAGSRSFIIYAAGFAEFNDSGAALQRELGELVASTGARLLGPNCAGMMNAHAKVCATFSTVVDQMAMAPGGTAFVGQSGAMAAYWLERTLRSGLGFSHWISTGNEVNVSIADAITYLAADENTATICAYIEGVRDGPALRAAFEQARAAGKPVLVLRSGKSPQGASAAASHTGAMAGEDAVWRSLFEQTGVVECNSLGAMVNVQKILERRPSTAFGRPLIMTVSGGAGALTTDAAVAVGMEIVPLPESVREEVSGILPDLGTLANPLDLTAAVAADYGLFSRTAAAVAKADEFDSFIIFFGLMQQAKDEVPKVISEVLRGSGKPVALIWMGASDSVKDALRRHDLVAFDDIPDAVDAVAAWNRWCDAAQAGRSADPATIAPRSGTGTALAEFSAQRYLGTLPALRWPAGVLVDDAAALAQAGLPPAPWVVKAQSGAMPHKTEHGGVAVNIADPAALEATVRRMAGLGAQLGISLDGVLVQEMVPHEHELIVGLRNDPMFGPLLVVGRGGTEAEFEKDIVLRLLPLTRDEIEGMLRRLRYASRLAGVRGKAGIDFVQLADAIGSLCAAYLADPALLEIEINPLAITATGEAVPLDLLMVVADEEGKSA